MKIRPAISGFTVMCALALGLSYAPNSLAEYDITTASEIWLLDEGEGDVAKDSSPEGNDCALWRGPTWVDGRFGKALHMDGQSFAWTREATGLPEGTSPRNIMCYFKWDRVNDFTNALLWQTDAEVLVSLGPNNWR